MRLPRSIRNGAAGLLCPACRVRLRSGPDMRSIMQSMSKPVCADHSPLFGAYAGYNSRPPRNVCTCGACFRRHIHSTGARGRLSGPDHSQSGWRARVALSDTHSFERSLEDKA